MQVLKASCVKKRATPRREPSLVFPAIWGFPKIGVASKSSIYRWIFPHKPSSYWGTPMTMETPIINFKSEFEELLPSSKKHQAVPFAGPQAFQAWLRWLRLPEGRWPGGDSSLAKQMDIWGQPSGTCRVTPELVEWGLLRFTKNQSRRWLVECDPMFGVFTILKRRYGQYDIEIAPNSWILHPILNHVQ